MAIDSRALEHLAGQGKDIARRGSVPKKSGRPAEIHSGMASQTRGTLGGPPSGAPPEASSPCVADPSRQGKVFAIPSITHGHRSDPLRGNYDPALAHAIMNEATHTPDDFARDLHTALPEATTDNSSQPVRKL